MADSLIRRDITRIAVPVSLEMVFQLVLGVIDQLIVGGLGAVAIAVVGLSNSVISVALYTLTMLGTGTAILVAQALGVWGILIARVVEEIVKTFFFGWRVGRFGWGKRAVAPC